MTMCIQIFLSSNPVQTLMMSSPKRKLSTEKDFNFDNPGNTSTANVNSTCSDVESPTRTYALIETDSHELDQIIDLLRQVFPKTKILDYNHASQTSRSQQQTSIDPACASQFFISSAESDNHNEQQSSSTNLHLFKGKVKHYLQRRYLEQTGGHHSRRKLLTKYSSDNRNSSDLLSSPTINKPSITFKSHSFDVSSSSFSQHPISSNSIKSEHLSLARTPSKRGLLRHYTTIDIDETSNDAGKITFSINQPDVDVDEEHEEGEEEKSPSIRYSYTEQLTSNRNNHFLLPGHQSFDQEQGTRTPLYPNGMQLPLTPYSASSDPGPFHSPWFNTPTSTFNFRFPQSQEQLHVNAQGTIAQLSSLTKMLCDEPSVFTPISPRFKLEESHSNTSSDSSSVPSCQICRQEFPSHQMYLTHYRTHLENPCEINQSDIFDFDRYCDRSSDLRHYSCKICSKRFSRSDMLNRHLRSHSGIRPYRCTMCNTYFSRSDHLSTHLRTHTGEKPYTCPQCSYTACRRDMITRHLRIHMKQRKNATSTFASSNEF